MADNGSAAPNPANRNRDEYLRRCSRLLYLLLGLLWTNPVIAQPIGGIVAGPPQTAPVRASVIFQKHGVATRHPSNLYNNEGLRAITFRIDE